MNLDKLLSDDDKNSPWPGQRKKFFRIIIGLIIILVTISTAALFFMAMRNKNQQLEETNRNAQEKAAAIAKLMQIQNEAEKLKQELQQTKKIKILQKNKKSTPTYKNVQNISNHIVSYDPGTGFTVLKKEDEDVYIPTGSVFQARLITPIKTSMEKTFVMAETLNEFRMDLKRKIPKNSRLIGRSHLNPILKGVIVEFDTLVLPSGEETTVNGLALSRNALPEIDGLYFSDSLQTYGTALAFGFLSGFSAAARDRELTTLGSQPEVSLNNQILSGLSTASFQIAEEMLRDIRNHAVEYVIVPAGEYIFVALTQRYIVSQGDKTHD
ncbi:MAG: TrbI/VirB10 family protein [Bdellovibrionales bacterium]|nr:TrbI/VirB10 family protein [Bdellovibrionales bacterium]